jgi:hypothetical protein
MPWGDERLHAAEHLGIDDSSAAVAVARRGEGGGEIIAEKTNVGGVGGVGHMQRGAGAVAAEGRCLHRRKIDVAQVESVRRGEPGNEAFEVLGVVELACRSRPAQKSLIRSMPLRTRTVMCR